MPEVGGPRSERQPSLADILVRRDAELAYGLLRLAFGINIATHGFVRFANLSGFVDGVTKEFAETPLPAGLVRQVAWTIAPLEAIIGNAIATACGSDHRPPCQ